MPVGRQYDFKLNHYGYMLLRDRFAGRAWHRTALADAPSRRSEEDVEFGTLPSQIDHTEVWEDWSGGFGSAYRRPERRNAYHWSENFDARFPRQLVHCQEMRSAPTALSNSVRYGVNAESFLDVPLTNASEHKRVGAGAILSLGLGYAVNYIPTNYDSFTVDTDLTASGMAFGYKAAIFGSYSYLPALTATSFYRRLFTGVVSGSAHRLPGRGFVVAGNRMWRFHGPDNRNFYVQSVAAGADPQVSANWSATLPIGDQFRTISDMAVLDDQVFLGMEDGIYAGDFTGTFFNVLPDVGNQIHEDNCRDLAIYQNGVVVPYAGGVFWYAPGLEGNHAFEVGPTARSNRSPVSGRIRAVRSYGAWVYAGLWSGSVSYLLAGRDASPGLPWTWYPQQRLPGRVRVHRLHIDSITVSSGGANALPHRFWVATDASIETGGTAPLLYFQIPPGHDNPLLPDPVFSPNYMGSARIDLGFTDWGAPGAPKIFRELEIWADNLLSGIRYADVYYTVDSGSRTLLGRIQTSPRESIYFSSGEGSFVTGQSIELSIESFTAGSRDITPIYRSFVLQGAIRADVAEIVTAVVHVGDRVRDRMGRIMRPGLTQIRELRALAASTPPAVLTDVLGDEAWVSVLPPIEEQEFYQEGNDNPEIAATVRMAILTFTSN